MQSQRKTSKTVGHIVHLSCFLSFVFCEREEGSKSQAYALVRRSCICLKNTQVPRFINCLTLASFA